VDLEGIATALDTPRGRLEIESPLVGDFNLSNLLAAVACGEALALPHEAMRAGIAACDPLPGRMERVGRGYPVATFIDFAHTEAALRAALTSLRSLARGRILVVFGCGGDRDSGKRSPMGKAAGELADLPIATSDNPRGEEPLKIIAEVEAGLKESGNDAYRLIPDRREAIRSAVRVAQEGDVILVAGKGHEEVQIFGRERLPFSDRRVVLKTLEEAYGERSD
jgi:UDP-N-acetylmuramoyl-L-alanyl-D-glutamate--2,6-diaminopimelate ligase